MHSAAACAGLHGCCHAEVILTVCPAAHLDVPDQSHCLEDADEVPGGVKLPPLKAVARRVREGVVAVVPALTKADSSNPPAVGGQVSCRTQQHMQGVSVQDLLACNAFDGCAVSPTQLSNLEL
jgi:hypothetical protein